MIRSFRYRLRPTNAQAAILMEWLRLTRELYNAGLQERRDAWVRQRVSVSCYDQFASLPVIRTGRPEFSAIPLIVLRGTLRRLDKAFGSFFSRRKLGGVACFPRFKSAQRWSSLLIDDIDTKNPITADGKHAKIPLLGPVKFRRHRPLEGTPKAMLLKLDSAGRWYVSFACVDVPAKPLPKSIAAVGIDLGLHHFAATSDGKCFENPRPLAAARIAIERAQRIVSRRKRGSKRRRKAAVLFAKKHAHIAAIRREGHIAVARELVAKYGTVVVEGLNIKGLARGMLAKSVTDAAWGNFLHWLRCKAESAGREVLEVDPRGTSQTCPQCGLVEPKSLAQREHRCACGCVLDRDVAAARVILGLGLSLRGAAPAVGGRRRSEKLTNAVEASSG